MTLEQGALCEPMSCILHGWNRLKNAQKIESHSKVLILGAGIIGNLWMCLLHHFGLRNVIVSEPRYISIMSLMFSRKKGRIGIIMISSLLVMTDGELLKVLVRHRYLKHFAIGL